MTDRADDLRLALQLADVADVISMDRFRSADLVTRTKVDGSIVTEVDIDVERRIRAELGRARLDDAILGEEFGASGTSDRVWTLDPIDGTVSFAKGGPDWATLIALVEGGVPVVGVVSCPARNRRWWAASGLGAFADGRRIHVSKTRQLAQAVISEDFRLSIRRSLTSNPLAALARSCASVHPWGYLRAVSGVSEGIVDVVLLWYAGMGPDLYSTVCILTEAGGRHSDLYGRSDVYANVQLLTNGLLHDEALARVHDLIDRCDLDPLDSPVEDLPEIKRARASQPGRALPVSEWLVGS